MIYSLSLEETVIFVARVQRKSKLDSLDLIRRKWRTKLWSCVD